MLPLSPELITIDEVDLPILREKNTRLAALRLDKIHPVISGNKWFKLKYYIDDAKRAAKKQLVTFGGAYSNHIVATAAAGELFGFKTTGIIRGENPKELSHTLNQAIEYGMKLIFTDREAYRKRALPAPMGSEHANICLIDEGGYGINGAKGATEILNCCSKENYSHITCAVGTSTMLAGLIKSSLQSQETIGVSILKNNLSLRTDLFKLLDREETKKKMRLTHDYHFGGYAKYTPGLINFMNEFYESTGIPTDFVYTGKLFCATFDMIKNNFFPDGSSILVIHSGGLQGNLSLPEGTLIF